MKPVLLLAAAFTSALFAQTAPQTAGSAQSPFLGAVPQGQATGDVLALTLQDALRRGLAANLGAVLSDLRLKSAQGERLVVRSGLLPNAGVRTSASSEQISLAAFGFPPTPGIPSVVGPFSVYDMRAAVRQTVLNLRTLNSTHAASQDVRAAELSYKDAREGVVLVVTALYLQVISASSRIDAAQAQVDAAQALYNQAVDFKSAGVVPAIDVLRAQVELQSQRQRLISRRNDFEKAKLSLARAIGLPDKQQFRLADSIPYTPLPAVAYDEALARAYQSRMDYQSLSARVKAAEFSRTAAKADRLPTLGFNGDYGAIGNSPDRGHGTYTAALTLDIPVFQGGRVRGEVEQADAALAQERARLEDLRAQIAFEIRSAMLDIHSAEERVEVSRSAVDLAHQQETQARDRFAAGVTNNLEVVQAQEALAAANEDYIASLYTFNLSKATLARAIGGIENQLPSYLTGAKP